MSRFTDFLKESLEGPQSEPGYSDNATFGNAALDGSKGAALTKTPGTIENREEKTLDEFIKENDIQIPEAEVETIIAIVDKSLDDWNREKKLDGDEISRVIKLAIEDNIINVKTY